MMQMMSMTRIFKTITTITTSYTLTTITTMFSTFTAAVNMSFYPHVSPELRISGAFLVTKGGGQELGSFTIGSVAAFAKLSQGSVLGFLVIDGMPDVDPIKVITDFCSFEKSTKAQL